MYDARDNDDVWFCRSSGAEAGVGGKQIAPGGRQMGLERISPQDRTLRWDYLGSD